MLKTHTQHSISVVLRPQIQPTTDRVTIIVTGEKKTLCINGPMLFKSMLLKGQLYTFLILFFLLIFFKKHLIVYSKKKNYNSSLEFIMCS